MCLLLALGDDADDAADEIGDTGVTFAVGSAVLFLVAWILSDVWEAMVMLLASGLLFAGISAGAFGEMVQEKRKRMKALEETKDK